MEQDPPQTLDPVPATVATRWLSPVIRVMHERHEDMLALASGLPAGGLEWQASDAVPSIGGIASHILLVEDYAIRTVAGEVLEGWTGENGQDIDLESSEAEICSRITELDARAKAILSETGEQTLRSRHEGNGRSLFDVLAEEMDHVAMHYGQMQIARQLFEDAHPDFLSEYEHWR